MKTGSCEEAIFDFILAGTIFIVIYRRSNRDWVISKQ